MSRKIVHSISCLILKKSQIFAAAQFTPTALSKWFRYLYLYCRLTLVMWTVWTDHSLAWPLSTRKTDRHTITRGNGKNAQNFTGELRPIFIYYSQKADWLTKIVDKRHLLTNLKISAAVAFWTQYISLKKRSSWIAHYCIYS